MGREWKFRDILVGADTGGFEGLGTQLLVLVGDEVDAERELIDTGTLAAKIEDADLRVGDTTVEAGLGVRLCEEFRQLVDSSASMQQHLQAEATAVLPLQSTPGQFCPLRSRLEGT